MGKRDNFDKAPKMRRRRGGEEAIERTWSEIVLLLAQDTDWKERVRPKDK